MTEEVKEILDDMKQIPIDESWALNLEDYQCKLLLNYITNLQQEIKETNDSITWWTNRFNALQKENRSLKNNYNDNEQAIHKIMKENEKLKDELKYTIPQVEHNQIVSKLCREKQNYKSRNEKAVEYIKNNKDKEIATYGDDYDYETCLFKEDIDELLNILQGGDE